MNGRERCSLFRTHSFFSNIFRGEMDGESESGGGGGGVNLICVWEKE